MDLGLRERVAIVGGSTRGLGRAIALGFAHEGANVTICGRTKSDLRRAEIDLARVNSQQHVLAVPADVTDARDIRRVVRDTLSRFGQINILVTQMSYRSSERLSEMPDDALESSVNKGFLSTVRFAREVVPYMKQQHWGRIVNLLPESSRGPLGIDSADAFGENSLANANQLALVGYAKRLANELAQFNITVNNLIHGPVMTDTVAIALEEISEAKNLPGDELKRQAAAAVPMGRLGRPDEVADLAVYLSSERSSFITGTSVILDGGMQREIH